MNALLRLLVAMSLFTASAYAIWGFSAPPLKVTQEDANLVARILVSGAKTLTLENTSKNTIRNIEISFTGYDETGKGTKIKKIVVGRLEPGQTRQLTSVDAMAFIAGTTIQLRAEGFGDPLTYTVQQ